MGAAEVSVVIPVFNGEASVAGVVEGVRSAFDGRASLQVVLVNDGSADGSHRECAALAARRPELVTYLRLSRNFGEDNAVLAGLSRCEGEWIVIMDDDGQNLPEDAWRLYAAARDGGHDVVYAQYVRRRQPWPRRAAGRLRDALATLAFGKPAGLRLSSFKCVSRWLAGELRRYQGPFAAVDALVWRATGEAGRVAVEQAPRAGGRSGYTWGKLLVVAADEFLGFSLAPPRLCLAGGLAALAVAALLRSPAWLWPGLYLAGLGLLGEYLARLLLIAGRAPPYVVRETLGRGAKVHETTAP